MKKYTYLFILLLGLFSCTKEVEINTPKTAQKLVVEGNIQKGEKPIVLLTKTGFYYEPININSVEANFIHGALITVSDGVTTDTLHETCSKNYRVFLTTPVIDSIATMFNTTPEAVQLTVDTLTNDELQNFLTNTLSIPLSVFDNIPLTCYYTTNATGTILGEAGKSYDLNITTADTQILSATTTIPTATLIDSISYTYDATFPNYAQVYAYFKFPLGKYIEVATRKQRGSFSTDYPGPSIYSGAFFEDVDQVKFLVRSSETDENAPSGTNGLYAKGDTAFVQWKDIDKATFDFLRTLENDSGATPFSTPTKILSNINGGIGIWAGYNINIYSVYVP